MVTSRSVPQQTAQIFSALAGQKRPGLRLLQIGQSTNDPLEQTNLQGLKPKATGLSSVGAGAPTPWVRRKSIERRKDSPLRSG